MSVGFQLQKASSGTLWLSQFLIYMYLLNVLENCNATV